VSLEPPHDLGAGVDGAEAKVAGELLLAPAIEHALENLSVGMKEGDAVNHHLVRRTDDVELALHRSPDLLA
jgi:hypothetical protein